MPDSLLPYNATPAELALDGATARISDVPVPLRTTWDPGTCSADLLPWLAWSFSVDEWSPAWSEQQKRDAIKNSATVHRYKGTIGAVKEAVAALGVACEVQEWFAQEPPGAPFTFQIALNGDQHPISQQQLQKLVSVVNSAKNLRSHLESVIPGVTTTASLTAAAVTVIGVELEVSFGGYNLVSDGANLSDGSRRSCGLSLA